MAREPREPAERAASLRQQLADHAHRYYVLDAPVISDAEYDALYRELEELEAQNPDLVTPDSPTQKVGGQVLPYFETVNHRVPMYSLDNALTEDEFLAFDQRLRKLTGATELFSIEYFCEPKIDGLAVSLDYKEGLFVRGATRGDGTTGEDVTHNLRTIKSLPLRLRSAFTGTVRGEVYIRTDDFARLNETRRQAGEPTYANPRNTAAGSIRQLDSSIAAARPLSICLYAIAEAYGHGLTTQESVLNRLRELGLPVSPEGRLCPTSGEVVAFHAELGRRRELYWAEDDGALPYDIDGLVVKLNDLTLWEQLGYTAKSPRYMIAFKWEEELAVTTLEQVTFQISRQGIFSPVAELTPVQLGGVTVRRATLHNLDEIARLDVMLGDEVHIKRGGEVIPKITARTARERDGGEHPIAYPGACPHCRTGLVVDERAHNWACPNRDCAGRLVERLSYFASRGVMDIEGMSRKTAERLVEEGLVSDVDGIYGLQRDALVALERFADVSVDNLLAAISRSRRQPLWRTIVALEIPQIGEQTAKLLARQFGSLAALSAAEQPMLEDVKGIGPLMARDIAEWFADQRNRALLDRLERAGLTMSERQSSAEPGVFADKTIVLTGTMSFATRDQLREWLELNGATVSGSVSKRTALVIAGPGAGGKLAKAEKLGVETWDEGRLRAFMRDEDTQPATKPDWWPAS